MDFKSWPKESLRRTLVRDYPGAKTSVDAVKQVLEKKNNPKQDDTALPTPQVEDQTELYKAMSQAIKEIELEIGSFNIDELDKVKRDYLAKMDLKTLGDIEAWKKTWIKTLRERSW